MLSLGELIKTKRLAKGWRQADLALHASLTIATLSRAETGGKPPNTRSLKKLADALGMPFVEINQAADLWTAPPAAPKRKGLHGLPLFDLSLSAGNWTDINEVEGVASPAAVGGIFMIRLAGDSMAPDYPDGQVVAFQPLRADEMRPGKDYYVEQSSGLATFKRLEKATATACNLRAINQKKHPKPMHVDRADIAHAALAVARVELL